MMRACGPHLRRSRCAAVRDHRYMRRRLADALLRARRRRTARGTPRACSASPAAAAACARAARWRRTTAPCSSGMKICGWRLQHLVQRGRPALGLPDDEEVGQRAVRASGRATSCRHVTHRRRPLRPVDARRSRAVRRPSRRRAPRPSGSRRCPRAATAVVSNADQAAVEDHHHAVADVQRGHAVGDDEQRQLVA